MHISAHQQQDGTVIYVTKMTEQEAAEMGLVITDEVIDLDDGTKVPVYDIVDWDSLAPEDATPDKIAAAMQRLKEAHALRETSQRLAAAAQQLRQERRVQA